METKVRRLLGLVASPWLFIATLIVFSLETTWLAVTTRFPMAFDEQFHFNLIQFFGHHLSPIVTSQASNTYRLGAIIQNPSFLYHYLLSFPYRLLEFLTKSWEVQVIGLRLINVAMAVASLLVIRRILKALNLSNGLVNMVVLALALTPIFMALSAQINYDNLLILLTSLVIYQTVLLLNEIDHKVINSVRLLALLCLCLFSSLVKFSFLPIFLAIFVIIACKLWPRRTLIIRVKLRKSWRSVSRGWRLLLVIATIIGGFLFIRFYGINLVRYHTPAPECNQVLNIADCRNYYSWNANYVLRQDHTVFPTVSFTTVTNFTAYWLQHSAQQLYGAIMPLIGVYYVSVLFVSIITILSTLALVCLIVNFRAIWRQYPNIVLLTGLALFYLLVLWARNYHDYLQLGQANAINGRYWLPVIVYLYAVMALAIQFTFRGQNLVKLGSRLGLVLVLFLIFAFYGGFNQYLEYITPTYGHISPKDQYTLPTPAPQPDTIL